MDSNQLWHSTYDMLPLGCDDHLIWKDMMFISTLYSGIRYSTLNKTGFQSNFVIIKKDAHQFVYP